MHHSIVTTYLVTAAVIFIYYTVGFVIAVLKKRNDIADVAWGLGFIIASMCPVWLYGIHSIRSIAVITLVCLWGGRLSWHIYLRNRGKAEDYRYQAWRESWGNYFYLRTYLQVFLLQGFFLLIIVMPVLFITTYQEMGITIFDFLGLALWIFGFVCEAVADYQLALFLKNEKNKGLILTHGLWRYSRHPNYFGEITQWWGIFLMALSIDGGIFTILGPLTITFLIVKVSGIPLLEAKMAQNPAFAAYKKKTSMLILWQPKGEIET